MQIGYLADHEEFLADLVRWHHKEWGHLRPGDTIEARSARMRACCGRGRIPTVFVAFENGEFVGSAMLIARDMDTRPELSPWMAGVFVVPNRRRRGIGAKLAERTLKEAGTLGIDRVYLYTFSTEAYYASLGWSSLERTQYFNENVVIMVKDLQPAGRVPQANVGAVTGRAVEPN